MRLVVRRAGRVVIDESHLFAGIQDRLTFTLRNVWGDGDPEVLIGWTTGGNHCCVELEVGLATANTGGRMLFHDFGNYGGWRGQRHHGGFYFVSGDSRFACAFTACAGSRLPRQVFSIRKSGHGFINVTRNRRDLIEANAAALWKAYLSGHKSNVQGSALGLIAAWCADQYLLGRKSRCDRWLAQALARGYLHYAPGDEHFVNPGGEGFIKLLHKDLAAWGYDRS